MRKLYLAILFTGLLLGFASCNNDDEVVKSTYTNYGYAFVANDNVFVTLDSEIILKFDEESASESAFVTGERVVINYEVIEEADLGLTGYNFLVKVLQSSSVVEKNIIYLEEDAEPMTTDVIEWPSASISNGLLNIQVVYTKLYEGQHVDLYYQPERQEEGENVQLVLANVIEGEELPEEEKEVIYDFITIDTRSLQSVTSPDGNGIILFDVSYNLETIYEDVVFNFQCKIN